MAMAVGPGRGVKSDINVTPLVDVVLVLLIIFMVITPMLQRGKAVSLPKALKVDKESKADPIIISVTADKGMYIESDKFDEDGFLAELRKKLISDPSKRLLLKGDASLTFDDVRKVMALSQKAGAKSIALGVEEIKEN